jgi:aminomethyltransferase
MNKTFLYDEHLRLGAKIIPFAGYEMPLYYTSIVQEHLQVRSKCGLFDISHMGLFAVDHPDFLITNHLPKQPFRSTYGLLCDKEGGCIDDLLIYKWKDDHYWIIGNAANREKDAQQFKTKPLDLGLIALQGREAPEHLKIKWSKNHFEKKGDLVIASTGYTGEVGFEIMGPFEPLKDLYLELLSKGVTPCGLGCRDTLRLEMGYALYGHELSPSISPLESVAAWAVKLDKEFQGKEQCIARKKRAAYGILLIDPGVPRAGYPVFKQGQLIGSVTSGTLSPSLKKGIALILAECPLEIGDPIAIGIREKQVKGYVSPTPFLNFKLDSSSKGEASHA